MPVTHHDTAVHMIEQNLLVQVATVGRNENGHAPHEDSGMRCMFTLMFLHRIHQCIVRDITAVLCAQPAQTTRILHKLQKTPAKITRKRNKDDKRESLIRGTAEGMASLDDYLRTQAAHLVPAIIAANTNQEQLERTSAMVRRTNEALWALVLARIPECK